MIRIKPHSIRSAFKAIRDAPATSAVLVFPHGIEVLSIQPETGLQDQQMYRLLQDFKSHLAGIYNAEVCFEDLAADIAAVKTELLLNNDSDETVD